jgi:hypothetical protein
MAGCYQKTSAPSILVTVSGRRESSPALRQLDPSASLGMTSVIKSPPAFRPAGFCKNSRALYFTATAAGFASVVALAPLLCASRSTWLTDFHSASSAAFDSRAGYLEWECERGIERDFVFMQPKSYRELCDLAANPPIQKLPALLREDNRFRLMFLLAFPHRLPWSIIGSLDHDFLKEGTD